MTPRVFGTPGGHAATLATRAFWQLVRLRAAAAACLGIAALMIYNAPATTANMVGSFVAILVAAIFWGVSGRSAADRGKANAGATSEKRVAKIIEKAARRYGYGNVVHGALIGGGGDVDHVVLGPIAGVVETKTGTGKVRYTPPRPGQRYGQMTVGRKTLPGDPVEQAARQASALARRTRSHVTAIVCVTDGKTRVQQHGDVLVCNSKQLRRILGRLDPVVDEQTADRVTDQIAPTD